MSKYQDQAIFPRDGSWVYLPLLDIPLVKYTSENERHIIPRTQEGTMFGYPSFRDGYFYDIRRLITFPEGKRDSKSYLYRRSAFPVSATWEQFGQINTQWGIPQYLIPLDKPDWFLGYGAYFGFCKDGKASPVALFRKRGDQLLCEEIVEMPFGDRPSLGQVQTELRPLPQTPSSGPGIATRKVEKCEIRPASLRPDLLLPAVLPDYLVLGASKAGVLWLFSLKNGQFHRVVDLGGVNDKDLDKLGHLNHFLLSAQPTKDHQLLVVTRDPDCLVFAIGLHTPADVPKETQAENRKRFTETMEGFTNLFWWRIDPETGQKERLDDPSLYPSHSISFQQQWQLRFLMDPQGKVHVNLHGSWNDVLAKLNLDGFKKPEEKTEKKVAPLKFTQEGTTPEPLHMKGGNSLPTNQSKANPPAKKVEPEKQL